MIEFLILMVIILILAIFLFYLVISAVFPAETRQNPERNIQILKEQYL